jgi:hypothetical protein
MGYYLRQGCFAQAGRPNQKQVIQAFPAFPRRANENRKIAFHYILPDEFPQAFWAEAQIKRILIPALFRMC